MIEDIDVRDNYREIVINDCLAEEEQDEYLYGLEPGENYSGIYCISNSKHFYIGRSKNIHKRWIKHKGLLNKGIHVNPIMQHVYDKYKDTDPLTYSVILRCDDIEALGYYESYYLGFYLKVYKGLKCMNIASPAKPSEKISREEWNAIHERKLSEPLKVHEYVITKVGERPYRWTKIVQLDRYGNLIKIWDSVTQARRELNICIHSEKHMCGGFQWQRYEDWLVNPKGEVQYKTNIIDTVKQYDTSGNLIREWEHIKEAADTLNVTAGPICTCLNGGSLTAHGYVWSYGEFPNKDYSRCNQSKKKPVLQYKNGQVVAQYESIREAAKAMNTNSTRIRFYIKTERELFGYIWKFQN